MPDGRLPSRTLGWRLTAYSENWSVSVTRLSNTFFIAFFGAALAMLPASAQHTTQGDQSSTTSSTAPGDQTSTKGSAGMRTADTTFLKKAAEGGMAEVELGQLAQQKASSEDVKKFGERMVNDHSKANDQLKQVAAEKHVSLPQELNAKDKATKARLEKLSGEQFDRAYMQDMVKDHKTDVAEFEHESKAAKDPAIKSFATQTLPVLQEHLREAERIAPMQKSASSAKSSGQ
jgi:putative membrane protein